MKARPFSSDWSSGKLRISLPCTARVAVKSGLLWRTVYDGSSLGAASVVSGRPEIELVFPVGSFVRVYLLGTSWDVFPATSSGSALGIDPRSRRYLMGSLAGHFVVGALLLFGAKLSKTEDSSTFAAKLRRDQIAELADFQLGSGASALQVPFGGVSYRQFLVDQEAKTAPLTRMGNLVKSLGKLDFGGKSEASSERKGFARDLLQRLRIATGKTENVDRINAQRFEHVDTSKREPLSPKSKLSTLDQQLIREKFREIQEEFKRAYNHVLSSDPDFSVTVRFAVTVGDQGRLKLSDFSPTGNFSSKSAKRLRAGMEQAVEKSTLTTRLAGTVIRGENVFVKQ